MILTVDPNNPNVTYGVRTPEEEAIAVAEQAALDAQIALAKQKSDILAQLDAIDNKSIRAIRTNDLFRIGELEQQAIELRTRLTALNG